MNSTETMGPNHHLTKGRGQYHIRLQVGDDPKLAARNLQLPAGYDVILARRRRDLIAHYYMAEGKLKSRWPE